MRWAWNVARMGEINAYNILVGRPEGKRPLGRPSRRWEHNSTTDLMEIGWEGVDWIHVAQDRDQWRAVVNTVINLPFPYKASKEGLCSLELVKNIILFLCFQWIWNSTHSLTSTLGMVGNYEVVSVKNKHAVSYFRFRIFLNKLVKI